jgi:hypothetical protein
MPCETASGMSGALHEILAGAASDSISVTFPLRSPAVRPIDHVSCRNRDSPSHAASKPGRSAPAEADALPPAGS